MIDSNEIIDDLIEHLRISETPMTVAELGLDHSKCSYSAGIDDNLTAGQGRLDQHGFWQIPCPACASALEEKLKSNRASHAPGVGLNPNTSLPDTTTEGR